MLTVAMISIALAASWAIAVMAMFRFTAWLYPIADDRPKASPPLGPGNPFLHIPTMSSAESVKTQTLLVGPRDVVVLTIKHEDR